MFLRTFAALALISVLALAVFAAYTAGALRAASYRSLTEGLVRTVLALRSLVGTPAFQGSLQAALTRMGREADVRLTVIDAAGVVTADSEQDPGAMENHRQRPEVAGALEGKTAVASRVSGTTGASMVYVAVPLLAGGGIVGVVRASYDRARFEAEEAALPGDVARFALLLLLACLLAAVLLSRVLLAPLRELTETVRRFTDGDHGARLRLRDRGDLRELADSFNSMAQRIQAQFREITDRKEELDGIFSSVPQGIAVLDARGRIVRINDGFRDIVGKGAEEGKELWDVVRTPRMTDLVEKVKREGAQPSEEIAIGERVALCSVTRLATGEGLIAVLHDVTDARRLEAMKRDFVVNASHELRTPLTAIRGYLEMIEGEVAGDAGRWLATVRRSADRMAAIVEDLLSLARLEGRETGIDAEPVDLGKVLADAAALFAPKAQAKGLSLRLGAPPGLPPLKADPFLIEQMVVNLVDNAVKYTEAGEVEVSCRREGDAAVLDFTDTGIGIPESHLPRIFERFYVVDKSRSRKLGGTGLGLSIVKHIVAVHGGTITVESAIGKGTRFRVRLPGFPAAPGTGAS